jgi:hypothetical protein
MDPARSVVVHISHRGARGNIELTFEEWEGSRIDIVFRDRLYRNSGVIHFDACTGRTVIDTSRPYTGSLAVPQEFNEYFSSILSTFADAYTFGGSPAPEKTVTYDASYHESNNYIQGDPKEIAIKEMQARIMREIASPGKCVVAGCSNGELVRQCRALGIDAYGFDVIPTIDEIVFPEVRDYVKRGSLTAIPYAAADRFDTLIAIDVLEHIHETDLPRMVDEWLRLGLRKLVLLINLNQFWFPGHVTLRPLWWWAEQWKPHFHHAGTYRQFPNLPALYSNTGAYNQQWTLWTWGQL